MSSVVTAIVYCVSSPSVSFRGMLSGKFVACFKLLTYLIYFNFLKSVFTEISFQTSRKVETGVA